MSNESPDYMTYLLRVWRAAGGDETSWRASLENPRSGERQAFRDLAALFAFLEAKTREPAQRAEDAPGATPGATHFQSALHLPE